MTESKMNIGETTPKIIAILIAIIVTCIVLIPIINTLSDETVTVKNEGSYFATPDEGDHTLVFGVEQVTVDGVTIPYPVGFGTGSARNATVIVGTDWMFRLDTNMLRLFVAGPAQDFKALGNVRDSEITLTISGDSLTYTLNDVENTLNGVRYYLAPAGDMVLCYNPYIKEDTQIIGGIRNNSNTAGADVFEIVEGSVADGFTATNCRSYISTSTPTTGSFTSEFTVNTTTVTTNLLKLTSINQTATFWNDATADITISYLLAPAEIEYNNPDNIGGIAGTILAILPVFIVLALLIVIVDTLGIVDVRSKIKN